MTTNSQIEILNSLYSLGELSVQRERAVADYDKMKSSISNDFYALNDDETLEPIFYAFNKRNDLVERVFAESKSAFLMLPESLQFGLKEIGKPLILPEKGRQFNPKAARCLVVKTKPLDSTNDKQATPIKPEYIYDVQLIDISGEK